MKLFYIFLKFIKKHIAEIRASISYFYIEDFSNFFVFLSVADANAQCGVSSSARTFGIPLVVNSLKFSSWSDIERILQVPNNVIVIYPLPITR